jgi:hypothetical protein
MSPQHQTPIISTHRGRTVVLGRRHVSPHVLGIARVKATELLDSFPKAGDTADWIAEAAKQLNGHFGMMGNDRLGDCTAADGPGHLTQIWSANNGPVQTPTDKVVEKFYSATTGYDPRDPSTDQGGIESQVLATWKKGVDGVAKLDLWVPVNPQNVEHVLTAIERYGACYAGVALPLDAQDQAEWQLDEKDPAKAAPGSWGGHAIAWSKYSRAQQMLACITWGMEQGASFTWQGAYCDEAYALFCSTLWCPNGKSPMGDLVATLTGGITTLGAS